MSKEDLTLDDIKAMVKWAYGAPCSKEEEERVKDVFFNKMSDWQTLTVGELDEIINAEENARSSAAVESDK